MNYEELAIKYGPQFVRSVQEAHALLKRSDLHNDELYLDDHHVTSLLELMEGLGIMDLPVSVGPKGGFDDWRDDWLNDEPEDGDPR